MNSFELKTDPREAQYARFAGAILSTLKEAVARRRSEDVQQADIADRAGMDRSSLSRILNGRVRNLTIKTISDILWAADYEPCEFYAEAIEDISGNYCPSHLRLTAPDLQPKPAERVQFLGDISRTTTPAAVQVYVLVPQQFDSRQFK